MINIKGPFELAKAKEDEWVISNGLGGFASSTIIGLNTRKYHGLLVSSIDMKRFFCVSKFDEFLTVDGQQYPLSTNQYPGVIIPDGFRLQTNFSFDFYPSFEYNIKNVKLIKSVFMLKGYNATIVRYEIKTNKNVRLGIVPLVNFRDFHGLTKYEIKMHQKVGKNSTMIYGTDKFKVFIGCKKAKFEFVPCTYFDMEYSKELERGYDFRENHFSPGKFYVDVKKGNSIIDFLIAGDYKEDFNDLFNMNYSKELERYRKELDAHCFSKDPFVKQLTYAADTFITNNGIVAGYPWFAVYGRDTFISLPGLLLVTKRYSKAKEILSNFAKYCYKGLIPNTFDNGIPKYNSVDTSLWFIYAVQKYLEYTEDYDFVKKNLYSKMKEIINFYVKGTDFGIRMDRDGLITAGDKNLNLTWMDAKIGELAVTPRCGKAVDVNALWFNALMFMNVLARRFGEDNKKYEELVILVKNNFEKKFWNGTYLIDVIGDDSFRPNQLLAISLPYPLIGRERARIILKKISQELVTPVGLRTLSPYEKRYNYTYQGNNVQRDKAYHNGTVWTWLLGPFITACMKVNSGQGKDLIMHEFIGAMKEHVKEAGIGTISEIFDGNKPFHPKGCISQAWSVGEILRVLKEDL